MQSMEVDPTLAGMLVAVIAGGIVDHLGARAVLRTLLDHSEWREFIDDRYDLLMETATALVER